MPPTCTLASNAPPSAVLVMDRTFSGDADRVPLVAAGDRVEARNGSTSASSSRTQSCASYVPTNTDTAVRVHRGELDVGGRQRDPRAVGGVLPHLATVDDRDPRAVGAGRERVDRCPPSAVWCLPDDVKMWYPSEVATRTLMSPRYARRAVARNTRHDGDSQCPMLRGPMVTGPMVTGW